MEKLFITLLLGLIATPIFANPFCFARATSYYQQVYCELEKVTDMKSVPSFEEFRNSSEIVQYSLLKRLAEKNYIQLPKPASRKMDSAAENSIVEPELAKIDEKKLSPQKITQIRSSSEKPKQKNKNGMCLLDKLDIVCDSLRFHVLTNRANSRLDASVFADDFLMGLPNYLGQESLSAYLPKTYNLYLDKMHAIGLSGVTMTYTKFVYFYHDIESKGLNFSKRFETMFRFLKKDKASMNASEKIIIPTGLSVKDCDLISDQRWACDYQGSNFVFDLQ